MTLVSKCCFRNMLKKYETYNNSSMLTQITKNSTSCLLIILLNNIFLFLPSANIFFFSFLKIIMTFALPQHLFCAFLPDTRTCHDPVVVRILFAMSTCWSRAHAVLQNVHHLYRVEHQMTGCARLFVVSRIFDSKQQTKEKVY